MKKILMFMLLAVFMAPGVHANVLQDAYQWEFDTPGDADEWTGSAGTGAAQATSINGTDGVLTSPSAISGGDPKLFYNPDLTLDSQFDSWGTIEFRIRQLDATGNASQAWDLNGTIVVMSLGAFNMGGIQPGANFDITNEDDNWIVVTGDISRLGTNNITAIRIDPIGGTSGVGKNFEIDYIRLTGNIPFTATNPSPFDGEENVVVDDLNSNGLSWELYADPNITGSYLYVTEGGDPEDPNLFLGVVPDYIAGNGIINAVPTGITFGLDQTIYWRVDTQIDGSGLLPDDPNTLEGDLWSFVTQTPAPFIESFENVLTAEDILPATMSATVTDVDNNVTSAVFTADDPNVVLENQNADNYAPTIDVKLAPGGVAGTYTITLTVTDASSNQVIATADVAIYADSCEAAQNAPGWDGFSPYDLSDPPDCKVNLDDLAIFVTEWLDDRSLKSQINN